VGDEDKSREQLLRELAILRRQISQLAPISDAMNQSLYGLNLYAKAATERLAAGDVTLALDYLQEFHTTTQSLLSTAHLLAHHLCTVARVSREEVRR
jgi:hypothetical protein